MNKYQALTKDELKMFSKKQEAFGLKEENEIYIFLMGVRYFLNFKKKEGL